MYIHTHIFVYFYKKSNNNNNILASIHLLIIRLVGHNEAFNLEYNLQFWINCLTNY